MNKKINRTQRNYIILGLCAILVIMAVGYAAFQSQLKISGTSNISSNWSVKIIDIQSKVVSGTPTNAKSPSYTDTTATFKTNLVSPGDTMQYDVTVSNEGNIDAKLDKITVPESANPAIGFEVSGIEEGSLLEAGNTALLTVIVKYNEVTSQPDNLTADLEVTLDYSQAPEGYIPPVTGPTMGGQNVEVVDSGDGLYADEYTEGRYVYRGANPNNYIEFNGELWRIIAKETDGTYKILRNELLSEEMPFDEQGLRTNGYCSNISDGCNAWSSTANMVGSPAEFVIGPYRGAVEADSSLNKYLNTTYLGTIQTNIDKIVNHDFNIGGVLGDSNPYGEIALILEEETNYKWNGKIALASASDYLNASSNQSMCNSRMLQYINLDTCVTTNWMYKPGEWFWLVSPDASSDNAGGEFVVRNVGDLGTYGAYFSGGVRPALYLSSDISLSGSGTFSDPYRIT